MIPEPGTAAGLAWRAAFWAPSLLYRAAVAGRRRAYASGLLETVRLPVPVYCVGNLTTGGSGKTPGVIWLAERLKSLGRRPGVVSRGYGASGGGAVRVVSDGRGAVLDASEAGDEPSLIARRLPGVPVVTGADRAAAARAAWEELGCDALVLDDGFQHHRLHRDVDLVCVDALADYGLFSRGGPLLPAGRLREPVSGLARAGVLFLTKSNLAGPESVGLWRDLLAEIAPGVPVAPVRYELSFDPAIPGGLAGRRVLAVSGLARPESFERLLASAGADVTPCRFPDHHPFTAADRADVRARAEREGREVIVTEKDRQRLPEDFPCRAARLSWIPEEDPAWTKLLR
jgi:tetraacyldisaccharide 4'-kinase